MPVALVTEFFISRCSRITSGALQFAPARQRLHGVLAMMQEEFQIETAHVAAGVARARRVQPHRGERIGKTAIDALDGVERKLPLRHIGVGQVAPAPRRPADWTG